MRKNIILVSLIILFGLLTRFIPHPPNFTPIIAMVLFGSVYLENKKLAILIPLTIMILSDYFLGYGLVSLWVYGSLGLVSLLGYITRKSNITNMLLASVIFFIVTNFGVWLMGYPKTLDGFILCYTLAIPFFTNTLISTIMYSVVFNFMYKSIRNVEFIKVNDNS